MTVSTASREFESRMMARALELAARAGGRTAPKPLVGAVVCAKGRIVGEGWHRRAGKAHAEVLALRRAGEKARGATLVVSLEPCSRQGRTPPCVEAIVSAGIARVVCAMRDPNPRERGRGIRLLRKAGIVVEVGVLSSEARRLNERFIHFMTTGRPFVALKLAQTLDGAIAAAPGVRTAISSGPALRLTHHLRSRYSAVLVGVGTVLADNPLLNVRGVAGAIQPLRVVLDSRLRTPPESRLVSTAGEFPALIIYDPDKAPARRLAALAKKKVELAPVACGGDGRLPAGKVLELLSGRGITSVLVEGGREVAAAFLHERAVQRLHLFVAPRIMGGERALRAPLECTAGGEIRLRQVEREFIGPDIYLTGRLF